MPTRRQLRSMAQPRTGRQRRVFTGAGPGRPCLDAIPDSDVPQLPNVLVEEDEDKRTRLERSFREFVKECGGYPDYNDEFHGPLCDFMGRMKNDPLPEQSMRSMYFPTAAALASNQPVALTKTNDETAYGLGLDGDFKGVAWVHCGDGSEKLILVPRNHLKSSIISVMYVIWRIIKRPAIRILIANAIAKNAEKFVKSIKWQLQHNPWIEKLWPHIHMNVERIRESGVTWHQKQFSVPRDIQYEAGEETVESIGVCGNLASRHYDLILLDDLMNEKNTKTQDRIDDVLDWYKSVHSLMDPVSGECIVVGTRWTYTDVYASIIQQSSDTYSLFMATAMGQDEEVFFPQKFSKARLEYLRKKHGPYQFSCFYLNQPVDKETASFKKSWLQFWWEPLDKDGRPGLPEGHQWNHFALMDPAITENDGDSTAMLHVAVNEANDWYVTGGKEARVGDVNRIVDMIFEEQELYPELVMLGIETRGWQKTIASGAEDRMKEKGIFIAIKELKSESNMSKKARIMRLIPRFSCKKIFLYGRDIASCEGVIRKLVDQILRFPRGHDDFPDALAYNCDVAFPPAQAKKDRTPSVKDRIMEQLKKSKDSRRRDEHFGDN